MKRKITYSTLLAAIIIAVIVTSVPSAAFSQTAANNPITEKKILRIGYFPNINHAQAVIGLGNGDFQKVLGDNVEVKTQIFNAGPSAIEALFANQIDVSYVGPGPAINGYVKSEGKDVRIIAGASSGGASFIIRNDSAINSPADLENKKLASPELGNTQDISLRKYLKDNGLKTKENGGNVEVLTAKNADIFTLFLKKEIDGAWVPEPWGQRLIQEANGKIFVDERDLWKPDGKFVTANIVAKADYLKNNPEVIEKLLTAHVNETNWINGHKPEAIKKFNIELQKLTGKTIAEDTLTQSLSRLEFTYDPIKLSLYQTANNAYEIGYLKQKPDLAGIYDLTLLNNVLQKQGLDFQSKPALSNLANASSSLALPSNVTSSGSNSTFASSDVG
jgi:NitT/TauT family transport system substrate-binding protein